MCDINVEEVLSKLTVAEKCNLTAGSDFAHTFPIPRLGIPALRTSDGPNTVRGTRFFNSTPTICLPAGPALAATWNRALLQEIGGLLGDECIAKGSHVLLGPCINIPRSPLGGRGQEAFGEDPMLAGVLAAYMCRGMQEKGIIATPKHFVCSDQEQGCFSMNCIVTERALREIYLMPFMLAIKLGDPGAIMAAYNKINGIHVSEDKRILQTILREEWGFQGLVMSDWHGLYSTTGPIRAGLDLEMPGPSQWRGKNLAHSLLADRLTNRALDNCVRNVLKMVKGAARSNIQVDAPERPLNREQDRELLRRAAAESIVLMKNNNNILPLDPTRSIAVIGPNAAIAAYRGGRIAHLRPYYTVTPLEAIRQRSEAEVAFAQGVYNHKERPLLGHQLKTKSGKLGFDMYVYTEPSTITDRKPVDHYEFLNSCGYFFNYEHPERIDKENWHVNIEGFLTATESGPYDFGVSVQGTASLYVDGKLVVDNTHNQTFGEGFFRAGTIEVVGTVNLVAGQTYNVLVHWAGAHTSELIKNSPLTFHPGGIRLGGCMKLDVESSIAAAAKLAAEFDQVVVLAGLMGDWETEGSDRANIDLPEHTDDLITRVLEANSKAVICISSGSPVAMPWVDKAATLLHVWYGGNETGNAISDVLYGDVNPSGKLPLSFPIRLSDNPAYLYSRAERRRLLYGEDIYVGYRFYDIMAKEVLFPFGHGLSYTQFALSDLSLAVDGKEEHATLTVKLEVANVGDRDGSETVQVYIQPEAPSVGRPLRELKGFEKVTIPKQAKATVTVPMELKYAMAFWDEAEERWVCEKGIYTIQVGTSSRGKFLEQRFEVEQTFWWQGL
ncbi:glycoside hydrolase family 3 protein [Dothidotthia symphoricarpi CBS 119687]|uniref:beta-glucosidase n=1 Tax=Dothidotthia symphoricarpi CBS 119687 TaxID=1392245 RepID=A0A6A6ABP7_9PLEO|nr:glycoside hydrolase family 3 protein [Dothidotthia symphoricarpi CBS 119687]KAF2128277.1 glycoside hydrolase family 3 protein [Dothidotthia symphoricarpi CBS 119687]